MIKTCTRCDQEKPATPQYFYRRRVASLLSWCIECQKKKPKSPKMQQAFCPRSQLEDYLIQQWHEAKKQEDRLREALEKIIAQRQMIEQLIEGQRKQLAA